MATTLGVRIWGESVEDASFLLDDGFLPAPTPCALGVPLMFKRLPCDSTTDLTSRAVVQFMLSSGNVDVEATWLPGTPLNLPPMWEPGTPGVLLARGDKLPFSKADWVMLNDYIHEWGATVMQEGNIAGAVLLKHDAFIQSMAVRSANTTYESKSSIAAGGVISSTAFLPLLFPIGISVRLNGLEKKELNGVEGHVVQYSRDRVGVKHPSGTLALKPERLEILDVPPIALKPVPESRDEREARSRRSRATQLADGFFHSIRSTCIPWEGEAEVFGMGPETRANKYTILNAWCALIKHKFVTKDAMVYALSRDEVRQFFEAACRKLAQDHALLEAHPCDAQIADAESVVDTQFAGISWDTLE